MTKKDLFVCSVSGGKDSTAMLLRLLESGMPVDVILFNDTGLEFEQLYDHIDKVEQYIKRYTDIGITRIKPEHPFEFYFYDESIARNITSLSTWGSLPMRNTGCEGR